jgi:hypothetical protein
MQEILSRAFSLGSSIRAILLSTTEGVPLGRVYAHAATPASEQTPTRRDDQDDSVRDDALASIESIWAPAAKQIPALGLEKLQQVTAIYDHGILCHVYESPLVRTLSDRQGLRLVFVAKHSHRVTGYFYSLWPRL